MLLQQYARQFLAEGFHVQAAYHARRSVAVRRTGPTFAGAVRLFTRIWRAAGVERPMVARMFALGPVRALRLQPD